MSTNPPKRSDREHLEDRIKGLGASLLSLIKGVTSEATRNEFSNIGDYVDATRCKTDSMDHSRAEYYTFVLSKLREEDDRIEAVLPLHFTSTLNKNSAIVDIGRGPVFLIDLYQGEILEALGKLYFSGGPREKSGAMGLRLLAEHFVAARKDELATYVAICRSMLAVDSDEDVPPANTDSEEVERTGCIQEAFLVSHEVGHLLWSRKQYPPPFIQMASEWIVRDHARMFERLNGNDDEARAGWEALKAVRPDLNGKSPYSAEHIKATLERRCDPQGGFLEEIWADFYAWTSCMRLFFGNWPAETVYRAMTLAMRNLATIDAVRRMAEQPSDIETTDDASTRRCVLRLGLRRLFGDFREDEGFRDAICNSQPRVTKADLDVDWLQIADETERRYRETIWTPMFFYSLPTTMQALADEKRLARVYDRCRQEFGERPALKILRDNPISAAKAKTMFKEAS